MKKLLFIALTLFFVHGALHAQMNVTNIPAMAAGEVSFEDKQGFANELNLLGSDLITYSILVPYTSALREKNEAKAAAAYTDIERSIDMLSLNYLPEVFENNKGPADELVSAYKDELKALFKGAKTKEAFLKKAQKAASNYNKKFAALNKKYQAAFSALNTNSAAMLAAFPNIPAGHNEVAQTAALAETYQKKKTINELERAYITRAYENIILLTMIKKALPEVFDGMKPYNDAMFKAVLAGDSKNEASARAGINAVLAGHVQAVYKDFEDAVLALKANNKLYAK